MRLDFDGWLGRDSRHRDFSPVSALIVSAGTLATLRSASHIGRMKQDEIIYGTHFRIWPERTDDGVTAWVQRCDGRHMSLGYGLGGQFGFGPRDSVTEAIDLAKAAIDDGTLRLQP